MREYEVTVVLKPDLDGEALAGVIERLVGWLTHGDNDNDAPQQDHWGHRALAYPIDNYNEGYYILFDAQLDPSRIAEIERNIIYTETSTQSS